MLLDLWRSRSVCLEFAFSLFCSLSFPSQLSIPIGILGAPVPQACLWFVSCLWHVFSFWFLGLSYPFYLSSAWLQLLLFVACRVTSQLSKLSFGMPDECLWLDLSFSVAMVCRLAFFCMSDGVSLSLCLSQSFSSSFSLSLTRRCFVSSELSSAPP